MLSEDEGGHGFKDLLLFNQFILAKESSRIIKQPDSPLNKVLQVKYFQIGNFVSAGLGSKLHHLGEVVLK